MVSEQKPMSWTFSQFIPIKNLDIPPPPTPRHTYTHSLLLLHYACSIRSVIHACLNKPFHIINTSHLGLSAHPLKCAKGTFMCFFILNSCCADMNIFPVPCCLFPIFPLPHPQTPQTLQTSPRGRTEWVPCWDPLPMHHGNQPFRKMFTIYLTRETTVSPAPKLSQMR